MLFGVSVVPCNWRVGLLCEIVNFYRTVDEESYDLKKIDNS